MGLPLRKDELAPDNAFYDKLVKDVAGYQVLASYIKAVAGINMPQTDKNLTLMAGRLTKIMPKFSIRSYQELHRKLEGGNASLLQAFIEALTTNKTDFFREPYHFEILPQLVDELVAVKKKVRNNNLELRVWCSAASKGHEPYSILFTLLEHGIQTSGVRLRFLASDIDTKVLGDASRGVYPEIQVEHIPEQMREKYLVPIKPHNGQARFKVKDEFRQMITFAPFNLMAMPYTFQNPFDIIFCRNVFMYFDRETVRQVKEALLESMAPGGYLLIGHAESGADRPVGLDMVGDALYRKVKRGSH